MVDTKFGDSVDWRKPERRQARRLAVHEDIALKIELDAPDDTPWPARCININSGGVLLEFPPDKIPNVIVDSEVLVTLQVEEEVPAKVPGIVRHHVDRRLGIFFPDLSGQSPAQEGHFFHNLRIIEREVLRRKRREESDVPTAQPGNGSRTF